MRRGYDSYSLEAMQRSTTAPPADAERVSTAQYLDRASGVSCSGVIPYRPLRVRWSRLIVGGHT